MKGFLREGGQAPGTLCLQPHPQLSFLLVRTFLGAWNHVLLFPSRLGESMGGGQHYLQLFPD